MTDLTQFNDWLKSKSGKKYLAISGGLGFLYGLLPVAKELGMDVSGSFTINLTEETARALPYYIQVLFLSYVVFFAAFKYRTFEYPKEAFDTEKEIWKDLRLHKDADSFPKNDAAKEKLWIKFKEGVNKTIKQFVNFWLLCWTFWLIFYIFLVLKSYKYEINGALLNLSNNLNALFFVFLFMTLSVSTSKYGAWQWIKFSFIIIVIFFINYFALQNVLYSFVFELGSAIFAGLAMAAFIGSINSRTISIPTWVLLLLTLYAAMQPMYIFFADGNFINKENSEILEKIKIVVLLISFFLKILLFLLVTWILQTGRLIHFIIQEGSLNYIKEDLFKTLKDNSQLKDQNLFENDY